MMNTLYAAISKTASYLEAPHNKLKYDSEKMSNVSYYVKILDLKEQR